MQRTQKTSCSVREYVFLSCRLLGPPCIRPYVNKYQHLSRRRWLGLLSRARADVHHFPSLSSPSIVRNTLFVPWGLTLHVCNVTAWKRTLIGSGGQNCPVQLWLILMLLCGISTYKYCGNFFIHHGSAHDQSFNRTIVAFHIRELHTEEDFSYEISWGIILIQLKRVGK